ncbi:MAG: universal stress protein [Thaumarchaeota archaeon]|nr:universal stress protein [Nitrososphaerota archaeon]
MRVDTKFSKILVAIDGSDISMKAADVAVTAAKNHGAKLFVVTSLNVPYGGLYMTEEGEYYKYVEKKAREEAEKWFKELRQKAKENNIEIQTDIIAPNPNVVGSIVNYADHNKVDLVMVGSTGKTGFKRVLLGSVASGIVTYSTCPVMVIK